MYIVQKTTDTNIHQCNLGASHAHASDTLAELQFAVNYDRAHCARLGYQIGKHHLAVILTETSPETGFSL